MSSLRNMIDLETVHGFRTFELWQGDITAFPVDVLAVSYASQIKRITKSSVVDTLISRHGINIFNLEREYDLHRALGVWLSRELTGLPFRRILAVDMTSDLNIDEILENLFASLALFEAKDLKFRTLALPVFGTGGLALRYDPEGVLQILLPTAKKFIERSAVMERVAFFTLRPCIADLLDDAMNRLLGRSKVTLPKKALITGLCSDIVLSLQTSRHLVQEKHLPLLDEFQTVLRRDTVRSFEIGILGRRIAEMIVSDVLGREAKGILARNIEKLKDFGIADWIISYFTVLRQLGNESAHETRAEQRTPAFVSEADLVVGLFCIQRLWDFWVERKSACNKADEDIPTSAPE